MEIVWHFQWTVSIKIFPVRKVDDEFSIGSAVEAFDTNLSSIDLISNHSANKYLVIYSFNFGSHTISQEKCHNSHRTVLSAAVGLSKIRIICVGLSIIFAIICVCKSTMTRNWISHVHNANQEFQLPLPHPELNRTFCCWNHHMAIRSSAIRNVGINTRTSMCCVRIVQLKCLPTPANHQTMPVAKNRLNFVRWNVSSEWISTWTWNHRYWTCVQTAISWNSLKWVCSLMVFNMSPVPTIVSCNLRKSTQLKMVKYSCFEQ